MIYYTNYSSTRYSQFVKPSNYSLTVPATSPAIGLESIKEHIKSIQGFEDYDSQLLSLIKVVTEYGEKITGRDFINKTYEGFLNRFPKDNCQSIEIRKSKLQSISSIQYLKDGVLTTFDPSKYYFTKSDNFSIIALEDGESWPKDADNKRQSVIITFISGYGDDSCDIPATLRQAMLSQLTVLFENAGDCSDSDSNNEQFIQLYKPFILPSKQFCVI